MNLEDLTQVKVYSASRHLEDARTAPSAVSIITADEIRRNGWRTLADALRSLRGFYTANDRQYTYLGIRGFLRPGDFNSRVLLQVNGHRLNDNVYGAAWFGTEFPLDLDLIDRIEVVRGPGSSLYGSNAVFGVINVITRVASKESAVEISGETESYLGRTGRMTAMGSKGSLSAVFSSSLYRSDGQTSLFFPQFVSPETNNGYAVNMDGGRVADAYADLQYGNFRLQGLFSDRVKKYPTASYGSVFNGSDDWDEDTRGYLDGSYHRSLSSETDLDVRAYYDAYNYVGPDDYSVPGSSATYVEISKARADWVGAEANLTHRFGKQRITAGGDYEYSIGITQRNYDVGQPDSFYSDQSPRLGAIYAEAELNLIPNVIVHAGGRVDWFSTFGSTVSPRLAFIYTPNAKTSVKYILGQAFRAPNSYEEFYADGITVSPPPEKLEPEQALANELVLDRNLTPWLSITVDGFYNRLKKLIDQVPDGQTGLTYFVNDGRVHAAGLEFEVDAGRPSGWTAKASYAVTEAENDAPAAPLANLPIGEAKLNGSMPVSRVGFAALELIHINAMTDYRGTRVPPYLLPSLTFSTKPLWGGWEFSSSLYDALNRRWYSPMGPNDPEDQIQQDGRSFRFKITYRLPVRGAGRDK